MADPDAPTAPLTAVPLFPIGKLTLTPGALEVLERLGQYGALPLLLTYVYRHVQGDWGDGVNAEDARANREGLRLGLRILSSYRLADGTMLWLITENDRSATTALLPGEY